MEREAALLAGDLRARPEVGVTCQRRKSLSLKNKFPKTDKLLLRQPHVKESKAEHNHFMLKHFEL
jgi:hypothetical protein